ncbi:MAG: hypothetical protein ACPH5V_02655 [Alcanivorax sp.]
MSISDLVTSEPTDLEGAGQGALRIREVKAAVVEAFGAVDGQITNEEGSAPSAAEFSALFTRLETLEASAGVGVVPIGTIVMWSGLITAIPAGWTLCDGAGGVTPDLRDKFVVGAGGASAEGDTGGDFTSGSSGAGTATATLNLPDHNITQDNLPEHSHRMFGDSGTNVQPGGNSTIASATNNGNAYDMVEANSQVSPSEGRTESYGVETPVGLSHPETDITIDGIEHTHAVVPPFVALAYIQYTGVVE